MKQEAPPSDAIHIRGARQNNLKNLSLSIPNGELVVQGPYQEESLVVTQLDLDQVRRTRTSLPLLRDERHALVRREIERITAGDEGARDKG